MSDDFTTLTDADLQVLSAEVLAQAEHCYRKARDWNRRAGEHRERLNRIGQEIMRRQIEKDTPKLD